MAGEIGQDATYRLSDKKWRSLILIEDLESWGG
jgi:hypothetical protein